MSLPLPCADFLGNNLLASLLASPVALATSLVIASRESEALMPKLVRPDPIEVAQLLPFCSPIFTLVIDLNRLICK